MRTSSSATLVDAADRMQAFVRGAEPRAICFEADAHLYAGLLEVVLAAEHLADNASPFVGVSATPEDAGRGWDQMRDELLAAQDARHEDGGPFRRRTSGTLEAFGVAGFARTLVTLASSVVAPARGLTVCLASRALPCAAWLERLRRMIFAPELRTVRFVLVVGFGAGAHEVVQKWVKSCSGAVESALCLRNESRALEELERSIEAEAHLGLGKTGAWPRGVAPPPLPSAARGVFVDPRSGRDDGEETETLAVRLLVKRGAVAMAKGDVAAVIEAQLGARDAYLRRGMLRDAIAMELMLGSYLSGLAESALGIEVFEKATSRAVEHEHWDLAAQASIARAELHAGRGEIPLALRAHAEGTRFARRADCFALAFESYWRAGLLGRRHGLDLDVVAWWTEAVAYARTLPSSARQGSQAEAIAQALSELMRELGNPRDARELARLASSFAT